MTTAYVKNVQKVAAGRLGGLAGKGKKSPHSRENGKLGGRPRKADRASSSPSDKDRQTKM